MLTNDATHATLRVIEYTRYASAQLYVTGNVSGQMGLSDHFDECLSGLALTIPPPLLGFKITPSPDLN